MLWYGECPPPWQVTFLTWINIVESYRFLTTFQINSQLANSKSNSVVKCMGCACEVHLPLLGYNFCKTRLCTIFTRSAGSVVRIALCMSLVHGTVTTIRRGRRHRDNLISQFSGNLDFPISVIHLSNPWQWCYGRPSSATVALQERANRPSLQDLSTSRPDQRSSHHKFRFRE